MNSYENDRADERFSDVDPGELHELKSRESLRRFRRHNLVRNSFSKLAQVIIFFVIIAVFAAVCLTKVFVIKNVGVVGTDRYTAEELLSLAGASEGDSLYSVRNQDVSAIASKLSFVKDVRVTRKLPQTLIFTVTEDEPVYYCEFYGEYFLLSDSLRVLDRVFDETEAEDKGLLRLELPGVNRALVGSVLVFENESDTRYVTACLDALEASSVREVTNGFDLRDKFDLEMICEGQYLVQLAGYEELATKLSTLSQVLSHDALKDRGKARIDVADPEKASVIFDITGEVAFSHR